MQLPRKNLFTNLRNKQNKKRAESSREYISLPYISIEKKSNSVQFSRGSLVEVCDSFFSMCFLTIVTTIDGIFPFPSKYSYGSVQTLHACEYMRAQSLFSRFFSHWPSSFASHCARLSVLVAFEIPV